MNPNKLVFPNPSKSSANPSPYERIQSAPPEGKEDAKNKDQILKDFLKANPQNVNLKVKNQLL